MVIDPISAGIAGAVAYGAADFLGGQASRVLTPLRCATVAQGFACVVMLTLAATSVEHLPSALVSAWAVLAGLAYSVGLLCLYQGFASASIGLVAPMTGLVSVLVPVLAGLALNELPSRLCGAGLAFSVLSAVLLGASVTKDEAARRSLLLGGLSGIGYGTSDVIVGLLPPAEMMGGLGVMRVAAVLVLLPFLLRRTSRPDRAGRGPAPPRPAGLVLAALLLPVTVALWGGFLDVLGHVGFSISASTGHLSVAAALIALHPLVSLALATLVLGDRLGRMQIAGALTSITSMAMLAS